jgi:UDP-N-acetylglucosamine 2-epimerase (non-hydrolysing)
MKIAPIIEAFDIYNKTALNVIKYLLVHTGQHYDEKMSRSFFNDLEIPTPDINLEVGSASHAVQVAEIMVRFERICLNENPTHVLVVGDVNSTIACALVASKLRMKIIHVEAGLRSFDRSMPEEINRVLTDAISDILFTTEESGNENLRLEGVPENRIYFVGNVMIDTLLKHREKAEKSAILECLGLRLSILGFDSSPLHPCSLNPEPESGIHPYALLTLHRPSNVDDKETLGSIIKALSEISKTVPIIFPVHPRTLKSIKSYGFENYCDLMGNPEKMSSTDQRIHCINPLGYLDFLNLMCYSKFVMTDSGGIQEETTILGIPCFTLRENTERPVTVTEGTNVIVGRNYDLILKEMDSILRGKKRKGKVPKFWDGKAAERIVRIIGGG